MPSLEEIDCQDWCVVWAKVGDDANAEGVFQYPQQARCRWVDRKTSSLDATGNTISLDAQVAVLGMEIPGDSILWHGKITEIAGTADPPTPTSGLYQVKSVSSADDLWGDRGRNEYGLQRYRNTIPTVLEANQELS